MEQKEEQPHYLAYMLRLCRYDTKEGQVWRAYLENPHSNESLAFADMLSLVTFLEKVTGESIIKYGQFSTNS